MLKTESVGDSVFVLLGIGQVFGSIFIPAYLHSFPVDNSETKVGSILYPCIFY